MYNVFHKRVASTSEWPPQNTIVNAIYYNFITQQRWSIGTFLYSIVLYIWYLAYIGSFRKIHITNIYF
jgi:hypothetical protein